MKTNYVNLNTKTSYSFLDSLIKINDLITFSLNNNLTYASIMDENVLYGAIEFYLSCKKNNLKPVIGFELNNANYHCLLIALNYDGYLNLVKICSFNQLNKTFKIEEYLKNVAVIDFYNNINQIHDHFYSINEQEKNYIACQTSKYLNKNDYADYLLLNAIKENKTIEEDENLKTVLLSNHEILGEQYLLNETEALKKFNKTGLKNLNNLLNNIDLEIKFHENHLLKFPLPTPYKTSKSYLQELSINGLKEKFHTTLFDKTYINRLKEELKIIDQLGFNDYFLIVHEYVNFAKKNNILIGPGRGSAVGSLVAYALNITDIDPIKYDLIFERFLNPARTSMPDIDIDIADVKRQIVIDHIFDFYNENNMNKVSYLITFQTIKLRTSIRDCGRVLKYDLSLIDKLSKSINLIYDENNPEEEIKKSISIQNYEKYKLLFDYVLKITGLYRQYSMHAAGIVLSDVNLYDIIPIQYGNNDLVLSQYPMEYLESLGLLKMDLLGLSNLTLLQNILDLIKLQENEIIDLNNINLNDEHVYNALSNGDTFGIFQFESPGMTKLLMRVLPTNLEDLSMTSAMYRPGPQSQINDWIKYRKDPQSIQYIISELEPILKSTSGLLVYQEQVMQIAVQIASFSLSDADLLRRAISKKHADELMQLKQKFIDQSLKNKISLENANKIYDYIFEFASYGFNHSHALAYALLSYQIAYLKYHYPLQFLQSYLMFKSFKDNQEQIIDFARRMKIILLAPDILNSSYSFKLNHKKNEIYFGFEIIKGIGNSSKDKLDTLTKIANLNLHNIKLCLIKSMQIVSKKVLESLILSGCYDSLNKDRNYLLKIVNVIDDFNKVLKNYDNENELLDLIDAKLQISDFKVLSDTSLLKEEISLLGFSKQILLHDTNTNENKQIKKILLEENVTTELKHVLLISFERKTNKNAKNYGICNFTYNNQFLKAMISPWKYDKFASIDDFFINNTYYDLVVIKKGTFINIEKMIKENE